MWNFVNSMGHPGHLMGPQSNQKREYSFDVHNVPIVPGKAFTNPNFVNKHHPSVHCYQNNFISAPIEKISHIDSSNVNSKSFKTNSALVNSSQSIIDSIKENQLDVLKKVEPNSGVVETTKKKPIQMCFNIKHNKRNRKNRLRKTPGKSSRQNTNRQHIQDLMDIEIDMDSSMNASDVIKSPNSPDKTFNLTDFIVRPNSSHSLNEDKTSQCDTDDEDFVAIISISPSNNSRTSMRERQLSLAESEDSFIVFESGTDEELEFSEESEDESDDESDDEEDLDSSSSVIPHKRVRFAEDTNLCVYHPMVQWSFAYQRARKGPWEDYARDRDRFQRRIANTERIISPIFDPKHREIVYRERFDNNPIIV